MPSDKNSTSNSSSKGDGINIQKALEILSLREGNSNVDHNGECHIIPEGGKEMGQTIHLVDTTAATTSTNNLSNFIQDEKHNLQEKRKKREIEIRKRFESMKITELLHSIMDAQEGRVRAYREYNQGLENVLESGNLTNYTPVCAQATASFSVISDTIKTIQSILQKKYQNRKDLIDLIRMLQQQEQEKLNITAALHLERIRANNIDETIDSNVSTLHLLQDSISSFKHKIVNCINSINEILDELRFAIADESEKD
mmetsp:Transcript_11238/g.12872  ORF Transcript_11238/g.12872 Transcript_11238/m.12872 type:complete len:256 (-) Transcript_11238:12-779(-)